MSPVVAMEVVHFDAKALLQIFCKVLVYNVLTRLKPIPNAKPNNTMNNANLFFLMQKYVWLPETETKHTRNCLNLNSN